MVAEGALPEADPPDEFDEYTIVLLYRGLNPLNLEEGQSDRLQRQHLGRLRIVAFKWYTRKGALHA